MFKNYSLLGPEGNRAEKKGLVEAKWYKSEVSRQKLKQLMVRRNYPAMRDTLIWFGLLLGSGYMAFLSWGTWWAILAFLIYGTLYRVPAYAKWHEFSHGTAFRTPWINEMMFFVTSFLILYQATLFRWSHSRHHTDTAIIGRDREFITVRPPNRWQLVANLFRLALFPTLVFDTFRRCIGKISEEEKLFIPPFAYRQLIWEARIWVFIMITVLASCVYFSSILPLLFIILPSFYGFPLNLMLVITQHGGLMEDVLDHRLNTRTFYTHFFMKFLYSNMNYHIEHHMYPMVPYYNLPQLHQEIKSDCPVANPSFFSAFLEAIRAIWKQKANPAYSVERKLPSTAKPFYFQPQAEIS